MRIEMISNENINAWSGVETRNVKNKTHRAPSVEVFHDINVKPKNKKRNGKKRKLRRTQIDKVESTFIPEFNHRKGDRTRHTRKKKFRRKTQRKFRKAHKNGKKDSRRKKTWKSRKNRWDFTEWENTASDNDKNLKMSITELAEYGFHLEEVCTHNSFMNPEAGVELTIGDLGSKIGRKLNGKKGKIWASLGHNRIHVQLSGGCEDILSIKRENLHLAENYSLFKNLNEYRNLCGHGSHSVWDYIFDDHFNLMYRDYRDYYYQDYWYDYSINARYYVDYHYYGDYGYGYRNRPDKKEEFLYFCELFHDFSHEVDFSSLLHPIFDKEHYKTCRKGPFFLPPPQKEECTPGVYIIAKPTYGSASPARESARQNNYHIVGQTVTVTEILEVSHEQRIRGKLLTTGEWISLRNTSDGSDFAVKTGEETSVAGNVTNLWSETFGARIGMASYHGKTFGESGRWSEMLNFSIIYARRLIEDVGNFLNDTFDLFGCHQVLEIVVSYTEQITNKEGFYYVIPQKIKNSKDLKIFDKGDILETLDTNTGEIIQYPKEKLDISFVDFIQIELAQSERPGCDFLQLQNSNQELLAFCDDQLLAYNHWHWWEDTDPNHAL